MTAFLKANGLMLAAALAIIAAWLTHGAVKKEQGRREVVRTVNTQAKRQVDAAKEARARALRPGAAGRLRNRNDCRDC